ncbi:phage tail tape measure protein [Streptacidiphilus albus]|uniref:phage tail tape measure protein n=1 Tax=Streptacidiphilus albus TaxID=105425 RepID=UPI00054B504B|nr:phage tail tape measure protein [Streptacidiphilus albus]
MSSEVGDLFVTLRGITDPFTTSLTDAAGVGEDATSTIAKAAQAMAEQLDASSKVAADSFKIILDAAVELAEGIVEPLASVKTSVRSVASALRALAKAAGTASDAATPALGAISGAAEEMAATVRESLATVDSSLAGMDSGFGTAAASATASATEMKGASAEGAAAAAASGDAAAASAEKSSAAMSETAGGLSKYALGLAAAGVGVFEAIKGATTFNSEMARLNTQAGVSKSQLVGLGDGVEALAGQVGQNPDSLAESLFHVESNFASLGIKAPAALNLVKIAAEGADVGNANLVDVTNSLTAAVASGIPGVQNMGQAMGALNAIVGAGDMQMQDLADAFGSGMVATVKGFGLSLADVGAALDVFGDNNIRGASAGTQLRMSVMALAQPVSTGASELAKLGLTTTTLATDMQHGGLLPAMKDLMAHMKAAGVTAQQQGQVITEVFGRKAGAGLNVLADQMDRLESKYPAIAAGAKGFGSAWATTSQTMSQEFDDLKSGLEALGIKIGQMLLPPLTKVLGLVRDGVAWVASHKSAAQALAAVLGGVLVAALWEVGAALTAIELNPVVLGITAVVAVTVLAYTHFKAFREVVNDIAGFLKTVLVGALHLAQAAISGLISWFTAHKSAFVGAWEDLVHAVQAAVKWFDQNVLQWIMARVSDLIGWWRSHSQEIAEVWSAIWSVIATDVSIIWDGAIRPILTQIVATWRLVWGLIRDSFELIWGVVKDVITLGMHYILNIIGIVLDLVTGHWSKAWSDVKHLVSQGLADVTNLIGDFASGALHLLEDAGKNIIKGLVSGIESAIGGVSDVMGDVTGEIKNFLPWSPAKKGPLSGSGAPNLSGAKIGSMVADGIASSTRKVGQAAHSMAAAAGLTIGSSGTYSSLAITANSAAGASAAGAGQPIIVQVDGRTLFKIMQTQALQNGKRNPTTGLVYAS